MFYIYKNKILYQSLIHRPNIIKEKHRIEKNTYIKNNRIENKLLLSRSIGDYNYKFINNKYNGIKSPVICIPYFEKFNKISNSFILMATDGLWEFIDNKTLIDLLKIDVPSNLIINKLINLAIKNGSNDNILAILIEL